jgi:formate-dependent nitrite reductase membrane component NrfD
LDIRQINPVINSRFFKPQHEWGWQVACDVFLCGMGGGSYVLGIILGWLGYFTYLPRPVFLWGFIPVAMGSGLLVLKLSQKPRFLRTILNPRSSWLSRGFMILMVFMLASFAAFGVSLLPYLGINIKIPFMPVVEGIGFIFGLGAMLYTGALIKSVKSVGLWNTNLLLAVFVASAFSAGLMALILVILGYDLIFSQTGYASPEMKAMVAAGLVFMTVERIVLGVFLYFRYRAEGQGSRSVMLLLSGRLKYVFWGGIMAVGYLLAIAFSVLYFVFPGVPLLLALTSLSALAGCLCLRLAIIYAGVKDQTPLQKYIEVLYFLRTQDRRLDELFGEKTQSEEETA